LFGTDCVIVFNVPVDSMVLSNSIDLSNAYWLYSQYTRHINFRQVFCGVRKMYIR